MNAKTVSDQSPEEPSVVGVRVRPFWSIVLYALLVISAGVALYVQRAPNVDPRLVQAAPWLFLTFALGFTVYRLALVMARRYSPFKAFIQIFLAALFFMLLLFPKAGGPQVGSSLLRNGDSRVRAMAAENAGYRGDVEQARGLLPLLDDPEETVRSAARQALVKLNGGSDLGSERAAWEARFP
ncbi:MAG: HEAT repeat domain-containing protein [Archangium sp.]